jgi:hypothetical protein
VFYYSSSMISRYPLLLHTLLSFPFNAFALLLHTFSLTSFYCIHLQYTLFLSLPFNAFNYNITYHLPFTVFNALPLLLFHSYNTHFFSHFLSPYSFTILLLLFFYSFTVNLIPVLPYSHMNSKLFASIQLRLRHLWSLNYVSCCYSIYPMN